MNNTVTNVDFVKFRSSSVEVIEIFKNKKNTKYTYIYRINFYFIFQLFDLMSAQGFKMNDVVSLTF